MQIGEKIKNYRKTAGLTQEQVANYLGVSTPAVNKWEKGNTYPDISLLPALARLLKIDMNELFSFREELTEKEIGQFVNELSEVSLDSFTEAFEMASRKIQEYPHCDLLIYTIATVLNGSLTLSDLNDEERMEYNTAIIEWLERTADSQDERVRNSSVFILATKYVQMEKYEEANALLKKIPEKFHQNFTVRADAVHLLIAAVARAHARRHNDGVVHPVRRERRKPRIRDAVCPVETAHGAQLLDHPVHGAERFAGALRDGALRKRRLARGTGGNVAEQRKLIFCQQDRQTPLRSFS